MSKKNLVTLTKKFLIFIDYNAQITEIESKVCSITGLPTTAALTTVENKMSDVSNLVNKRVMMRKYQTLKINLLLRLITINLLKLLLLIR